jgi:hypothetical protein
MLPEHFVSPSRVRVLQVADHAVPDISVLNQTLQCMGEIAPSGALVLTEAVHLQHWLPREANPEDPLWVIALPDVVSADLLQLAQIPPVPVNYQSEDLLHSSMFVEWMMPKFTVRADKTCVKGVGVSENSFIYTLFATPSRAILVCMPQDEDFVVSLQGASMASGENYNPYRIWSDEQLEAASRNASTSECDDASFGGDEWTIQLRTFTYVRRK